MKLTTLITCEHAGNDVPENYDDLFDDHHEVLSSHRGWDPGAYNAALHISTELGVPLFATFTSRLVVEANRSAHSPQLFSEYIRDLSAPQKEKIIQTYYAPYRDRIEQTIRLSLKPVLHLSIHSFTPVWNNEERQVDIGLLFDPARELEQTFCTALQKELQLSLPEFKIDFNQPYKGTDDGFTTYLRTKFPDSEYAGIEIELNQKYVDTPQWIDIKENLALAFKSLC